MSLQSLPLPLRVYLLSLGVLGIGFGAAAASHGRPLDPLLTTIILALALAFSAWRVELTVARGKMTLTFAAVTAGLLLGGPNLALLAAVLGAGISTLVAKDPGPRPLRFRRTPVHLEVASEGV